MFYKDDKILKFAFQAKYMNEKSIKLNSSVYDNLTEFEEFYFCLILIEKLSQNSKICQMSVHRKLFNDCFVVYLRREVSYGYKILSLHLIFAILLTTTKNDLR